MSLLADDGRIARKVRSYVSNVLEWDAAVARIEASQRGAASATFAVLETLRLGVVGTGNRGTKGTGRVSVDHDLCATRVDPVAAARYRALRGDALRVTDAVLSDGQGDVLVEVEIAHGCTVPCNLAQRVARVMSPMDVVLRWHAKLMERDAKPALAAAEKVGENFLVLAADSWWCSLDT